MLSPRSSITSLQEEFKDRLQTLADVLGFDAKFEYEYPGWSYAEHSPVRDVFLKSYRELFDTELRIESIHAGLECGLFAEALDGLDAIAVGPTLKDVHTPDESMELASSERFYTLLVDVLNWSYAEHSPVRDVFLKSYRELFDTELRIESIHAGLECGLFAEALDGLDAIAVGPTLKDVLTTDESMELASSERFYTQLVDVLKRLAA